MIFHDGLARDQRLETRALAFGLEIKIRDKVGGSDQSSSSRQFIYDINLPRSDRRPAKSGTPFLLFFHLFCLQKIPENADQNASECDRLHRFDPSSVGVSYPRYYLGKSQDFITLRRFQVRSSQR